MHFAFLLSLELVILNEILVALVWKPVLELRPSNLSPGPFQFLAAGGMIDDVKDDKIVIFVVAKTLLCRQGPIWTGPAVSRNGKVQAKKPPINKINEGSLRMFF